jgi:ABC-2 type transport system ATP-binding protein
MSVIRVENLTKDYGRGRGVFDISFEVENGEVFGFLGPNGAGKTTTIRHIMGFSRPQAGSASVEGLDSWRRHYAIQRRVGYLPGEIAMPESLTGLQFIRMMARLRGMRDMSHTNALMRRFELDASGGLKRMSLGMKRKLAVVAAFMHDPPILVLDEPTSGLDPIMQETFVRFIIDEKKRGKSILLSSHMFAEVDATCDRISIIKDGRLVSVFVADELRHNANKQWKIEFVSAMEFERFREQAERTGRVKVLSVKRHRNQAVAAVSDRDVNAFISEMSDYALNFMTEVKFTLEDYFMRFYEQGNAGGGAGDAAHQDKQHRKGLRRGAR